MRLHFEATRLLCAWAILYAAVYAAWDAFWREPAPFDGVLSNVAFIPAGLPATLLAWGASKASADAAVGRAWRLLALGFLLYWAGDAAWGVGSLAGISGPSPRFGDYLYLVSYPASLFGLLRFTSVPAAPAQRFTFWLDAATVVLAGGMVCWRFLASRPTSLESPLEAAVLVAYPIGDLVLILGAAVAQLRSRDPRLRLPLLLLVAAFSLRLVNDAEYGARVLGIAEFLTGSSVPFMLAWASLAGAAYTHRRLVGRAAQAEAEAREAGGVSGVPYLALLLGFGVLLDVAVRDSSPRLAVLVVGSAALAAVVALRQFVASRDNLRLLGEKAARDVEAQLRGLLEGASELLVVLDGEGRIRYQAPSTEGFLGYPADELAGRRLLDLVPPDASDETAGRLREVLERGLRARWECRLRRRDGGLVVVEASARRLEEALAIPPLSGPDRGAVVLAARDVTRLLELQAESRRNETLAAMGRLVAGVAHEVRNPLFALSATVDAFEADGGAVDRDAFPRIRREVDRLSRLMEELLELARPSGGERHVGPFLEVVNDAVTSCQPLADRGRVRLNVRQPENGARVLHEPGTLSQALRNVIENAIHHSPEGATVRIECLEVQSDGEAWLDCRVEDEGPGFRDEDLPRIFEPFFTRRRGGTGLGLAIALRYVQEHGGRLLAGNRASGGAAVTIRLPLASMPARSR